jgi:Cu(I)/Ag(I) efflux system membrane fusion protein
MKKTLILVMLSVIVGLGAGWILFRTPAGSDTTGGRKILYYRDPMHPQNTSPTPRKASDGMDYVPVYADQQSGDAAGGKKILYYKDPMHPWYTSDKPGKAPDCGMDLVPVYEGESDAEGIRIDPTVVQDIGVKVEKVMARSLSRTIRTTGIVQANETSIHSINSKVMGWVERLYVDYTGMPVRKGEPMLSLYSPELVSTQQEYLQAIRYQKELAHSSMKEARDGGNTLVESARRRLSYWDIPDIEIQELEQRGTPEKSMTLYSPVDGYVMDKAVFKGQNVAAGMELFRIADLSTVWVIADIYQFELPWVKIGQPANITLSYHPGTSIQGKITYIYPTLSMDTRTAKVRIEVRNSAALELKPGMFATVQIASPVRVRSVAVPEQAVIRSGERNIVVVALGGGYFEPRDVTLGVSADGYQQVVDGLRAGENIVTSSQFLIDSESNLRAALSQMSRKAQPDSSKSSEQTPVQPPSQTKAETSDMSGGTESMVEKQIDPVCGMVAGGDERLSYAYNGKKYYFCSKLDLEKFKANPEKYIKSNAPGR